VSEAQSVGCTSSVEFPTPKEVEEVKVVSQVYSSGPLDSISSPHGARDPPGPPSCKTPHDSGTALGTPLNTLMAHSPGKGQSGSPPGGVPHPSSVPRYPMDASFSPSIQAADHFSFDPAGGFTPPPGGVDTSHTTPPLLPRPPVVPDQALPVATLELLQDRLGKLVLGFAAALGSCSFLDLCMSHRGSSCLTGSSMAPHPAIPILQQLRDEGARIHRSAPDWTLEKRDAAVRRGAHQSTRANSTFVREEFADMVEAGQWLVLPYALIWHLPGLCLSPTGLVPQRDRRDRLIVDYTFSGVNPYTISTAPDSLQFGHALLRILQYLHRADTRRRPIYLAKVDIADAFMRVQLYAPHIPILGALLPSYPGETPLVAFPMILPMGWVESPPYLCAVTETIADTANKLVSDGFRPSQPHHRLDGLADSQPAPTLTIQDKTGAPTSLPAPTVRSRGPLQAPLNVVEVYMDDFILLSQLPLDDRVATRRVLFECIDAVIRPLTPGDNPKRKEPNSVKKLSQGDAHWSQRKAVLGWLIDTKVRTIELLPHRRERLLGILAAIPRTQRRTSRHKWQILVGEIRSMAMALPGGRGLFSQLQSVLTYPNNPQPSDRLRLTPAVHDQLDDFRWLASTLTSRLTRWGELVNSAPSYFVVAVRTWEN
jgi:hypothetical protein